MKKSAIYPDPQFYSRYIDLLPDVDLKTALDQSVLALDELDLVPLEIQGNDTYAPGKWTVKNVLQHITDTERVFTYRCLLFARNDQQKVPGMDQDLYAANTFIDNRRVQDILTELKAVRAATIALFNGFSNESLLKTGISWQYEMSVLALGFTIAGHQCHHLRILRERYLK